MLHKKASSIYPTMCHSGSLYDHERASNRLPSSRFQPRTNGDEYASARGVEGTRRIESAHPWKLSPRPWGVLPKESWMVKRGDWFRKHRVPGCCSGRRRNSHSCPMARHGFRLGPTPCRSHASAMPIGVGRHHQTNQSQTKDLTERIADALVSAMCLCIFGKAKRKRL